MSGDTGREDDYPYTSELPNRQEQAFYTGTTSENDAVSRQSDSSQLFIVRVWNANNEGTDRWRGRIQHVLRGESYSFTGWSQLMSCLEAMLRSADGEGGEQSKTLE